jgi:hypothetical protein
MFLKVEQDLFHLSSCNKRGQINRMTLTFEVFDPDQSRFVRGVDWISLAAVVMALAAFIDKQIGVGCMNYRRNSRQENADNQKDGSCAETGKVLPVHWPPAAMVCAAIAEVSCIETVNTLLMISW